MSSFNEAMTQIRELEERAMEELKEIIQVGSWPRTGRDWVPTLAQALHCDQHHSLNVTCALLP